jgi:uncharacterized membrane protein
MNRSPSNATPAWLRHLVLGLQTGIWWLAHFWLPVALLLAATLLMLAFLAPALQAEGYTQAAQTVYRWLAPHDHQLPHRSYYLFGQQGWLRSYSLDEVQARGANPDNLRAFTGDATIGYKMALNHRMVAIFVGILLGGMGWAFAGQRPKIGVGWFLLMAAPMLIDGFSHMQSDLSGSGARQINQWVVWLSGNAFSTGFYQGSNIGTLNWGLRTFTGLLFGVGLVWFLFTYLSVRFALIRARLGPRLKKAGYIK